MRLQGREDGGDTLTDLGESGAEAGEHFPHVPAFLHADDAQVILLVHPNQGSSCCRCACR